MTKTRQAPFKTKFHFAFIILVGCCLLEAFGMGLILNCTSLFYVPICNDLGFSRAEISTFMTGYFVGTTIFTPLMGRWLSKHDTRVIMSICIVLLSGSLCACSMYTEIWQWQISGFIMGGAGAGIFVLPAASMIGNWFVKRRGFFHGITFSFTGISAAINAQIIGYIILAFGWRSAYLFVGIASFVVILPLSIFIFCYKPADMGMLPYGADSEEAAKDSSVTMRGVSLKVAVASAAFWCLFLFGGIASFCHGGIEQHMPGYIQSIGFTASFAATVVSGQALGSVLDKWIMGWLNDKIGVRWTTIVELICICVGIAGFVLLKNPAALIFCAILFGVQDSLMSCSLPLLIRDIFGSKHYTEIHGWIRAGVGLFGTPSGILVGAVYDNTGSFVPAFWFLVAVCIFAIGCVFIAYRTKHKLNWDHEEEQDGLAPA